MAISSTAVLPIAVPINIVHFGCSMLSNVSAHLTAPQEIPTGLTALGMTCMGKVLYAAPGPATTDRVLCKIKYHALGNLEGISRSE